MQRRRTLAHLSDLHVGRAVDDDRVLESMCQALLERRVEHVVVTGDVTHRGRRREWARFQRAFAPLAERGILTVIPGNHDRLNDDVGVDWMPPGRIVTAHHPGLYLVAFDSTGPHNRSLLSSHGDLGAEHVEALLRAFDHAPPQTLNVLLLHHHLLPLPHDNRGEQLLSWLGWTSAAELPLGRELLAGLRGRCDLVLHGHRHDPVTLSLYGEDARPLSLFNAGSSTELKHVRLFRHELGRLAAPPTWVAVDGPSAAPFHEYVGAPELTRPGSLA